MNITEIRVKLVPDGAERLKAFCSITLDGDFVVRDLKVIDGVNGLFVAMPSRKLCDRCPRCGSKNHLRSRHCNECGVSLGESRASRDEMGRAKLHADIAHPINAACRERLQKQVIEAYQEELERSREPGYQPPPYEEEAVVNDDAGLVGAPAGLNQGVSEQAGPAQDREDGYDSLIAGLNQDSKTGPGERPREEKDRGMRGAGRGPGPSAAEPQAEPVGPGGGSRGNALDDFLSRLGTSGSGSGGGPRRRPGRRGSGRARKGQKPAADESEPAVKTASEHTREAPPAVEPEPAPTTPPQPVKPDREAEDDDFSAGIL